MTAGKWALLVIAVLSALAAGFSAVPYGWAHIAAAFITAAIGTWSAVSATVIHMTGKGST